MSSIPPNPCLHERRDGWLSHCQERKRAEGSERELGQERGRVEDAYRRVARLEGELGELGAALEQKQEVVTALQVGWKGQAG